MLEEILTSIRAMRRAGGEEAEMIRTQWAPNALTQLEQLTPEYQAQVMDLCTRRLTSGAINFDESGLAFYKNDNVLVVFERSSKGSIRVGGVYAGHGDEKKHADVAKPSQG